MLLNRERSMSMNDEESMVHEEQSRAGGAGTAGAGVVVDQYDLYDQEFKHISQTMLTITEQHIPTFIRLSSLKHPSKEVTEELQSIRTDIEHVMQGQVLPKLQRMRDQLGMVKLDDVVALVLNQDQIQSTRSSKLEQWTIYGQLFAQQVMTQYVDGE